MTELDKDNKASRKMSRKASRKVVRKVSSKRYYKVSRKRSRKTSRKVSSKRSLKVYRKRSRKVSHKASRKVVRKVSRKVVRKVSRKVSRKASHKVSKVSRKRSRKASQVSRKKSRKASRKVSKVSRKRSSKGVSKPITCKSKKILSNSTILTNIIVTGSGIVGLAAVGGGIFAYYKLRNNNKIQKKIDILQAKINDYLLLVKNDKKLNKKNILKNEISFKINELDVELDQKLHEQFPDINLGNLPSFNLGGLSSSSSIDEIEKYYKNDIKYLNVKLKAIVNLVAEQKKHDQEENQRLNDQEERLEQLRVQDALQQQANERADVVVNPVVAQAAPQARVPVPRGSWFNNFNQRYTNWQAGRARAAAGAGGAASTNWWS